MPGSRRKTREGNGPSSRPLPDGRAGLAARFRVGYKAVLVIRLLVVLTLLPGCVLIDRAARFTDRAVTRLVGGDSDPAHDALYIQLQLSVLSDSAVQQLVQQTEAPLLEARDSHQREMLLRLRLNYAFALWNAASGPNPYANGIQMLVTLAVGQKVIERSAVADVLGPALEPTLDVLAAAQQDTETLVRGFLAPAEYTALRAAIDAQALQGAEGRGLTAIDLPELLGAVSRAAGPEAERRGLFRILGMDPFAGLDPATREIAESRQFGERLLFNLQRLPYLLRLQAELLVSGTARDLELDRILTSLDMASASMEQVAQTVSALPDRLNRERALLVADVRAQAELLGTLARDYRGTFEAATTTAATADQALSTFGSVVDRFQSADRRRADPGRPFDITEYSRTAVSISETTVKLADLVGQVEQTLNSPGAARLPQQLAVVLEEADARGRRMLYSAFGLGCGLIAVTCLAVVLTASVLRRLRRL